MATNREPQNPSSSEANHNEFDADKQNNMPQDFSVADSQEHFVIDSSEAEELLASLTNAVSSGTKAAKQETMAEDSEIETEATAKSESESEAQVPVDNSDHVKTISDADSSREDTSATQATTKNTDSADADSSEEFATTVAYESISSKTPDFYPPQEPVIAANQTSAKTSKEKRPWWMAWQLWGLVVVILSGGIGYAATSMLLKLPKTQSCNQVFWPVASASVRLYCAQTYAENKSVKGLLEAIELVAVLPENHPLRPEINRNIERWATSILEVGEQQFQQGELQQAIATAQQIPETVEAHKLVKDKINNWQSVWDEGEKTFAEVEKRLRAAEWNEAFSWAVRLTDNPNQYWATTKYQESIDNINIAQEENASLVKAKDRLTNGNVEDLLVAIEKAKAIKKDSYAYERAQKIVTQAKAKLVANVESLIKKQQWSELLQVTNRIPYSLGMSDRVKEWNILAGAGTSANLDTVYGIEEAISEAKKLKPEAEYYQLAQQLISRWELEIGDIKHLSAARELARVGTIANLNKAIAEVSKIPSSNPRYSEARQEMLTWRREIQTIEDRPILNRAKELAFGNDIDSWRRAISEANLITSNSPLYSEAQNYIRDWRANIERIEDRPILDEAVAFANEENYAAAVEQAGKISPGTALYSEAQGKIKTWRQEIEARQYFQDARMLSASGSPEDLAKAIIVIRQVAEDTSVRPQVADRVTRWSEQILSMARAASNSSLERAIAIAQQVPSGTASYNAAQADIKAWQAELLTPEPEPLTLPPSFKLEKLEKDRRDDNLE